MKCDRILLLLLLPILLALAATTISVARLASPSAAAAIILALDANPSGNGPRTVGSIEQCVSATVGQSVNIDIVIPSPGIPDDRGIAASQFNLYYDPDIVWIEDDANMLLSQAAGSSVVPITDPRPDKNGIYISWAIDFGPNGIEPNGSSETGPGVISRITLLPRSKGLSDLALRSVIIIADNSQRIDVDSVQSGTIAVGEPCPTTTAMPTSAGSTSAPGPATPTPTATPGAATPTTAGATSTPEAPTPTPLAAAATVRPFPDAGTSPNAGGGASWWFIVTGLIATLGGASLLIGGKLALSHQSRRPAAPVNDWRRRPPDDG